VIDELKAIGCDTAKDVLKLTTEELARRTRLEESVIESARKVLESEFEEEK
jgi:N utilization substance protein A